MVCYYLYQSLTTWYSSHQHSCNQCGYNWPSTVLLAFVMVEIDIIGFFAPLWWIWHKGHHSKIYPTSEILCQHMWRAILSRVMNTLFNTYSSCLRSVFVSGLKTMISLSKYFRESLSWSNLSPLSLGLTSSQTLSPDTCENLVDFRCLHAFENCSLFIKLKIKLPKNKLLMYLLGLRDTCVYT